MISTWKLFKLSIWEPVGSRPIFWLLVILLIDVQILIKDSRSLLQHLSNNKMPIRPPLELLNLQQGSWNIGPLCVNSLKTGLVGMEMCSILLDKALIVLYVEKVLENLQTDEVSIISFLIDGRLCKKLCGRASKAIICLFQVLQGGWKVTFRQLGVDADFERVSHVFSLILVY